MKMREIRDRFYALAKEGICALKGRPELYFPEKIKKPSGSRVLVLAPHFDDDIIGCGGTLCKHKEDGDNISIVYFTDGEDRYQAKINPAISQIRKDEARKAAGILGIEDLIFFDFPEKIFSLTKAGVEKLTGVLDEKSPDLVYLPWFLDGHSHHILVNRFFCAAAKEIRASFMCCAYEVWTPLVPNIIVDITEYADLKKKAIARHKSQLANADLSRVVFGLNSYRTGGGMWGKGYAEAFLYLDCKSYMNLIEKHIKNESF